MRHSTPANANRHAYVLATTPINNLDLLNFMRAFLWHHLAAGVVGKGDA
jgi:hypothetical protein